MTSGKLTKIALTLVLATSLLLSACAPAKSTTSDSSAGISTATTVSSQTTSPSEDTSASSTTDSQVKTVKDGMGRQVEIPAQVDRVVSAYYSTSNAIITLGAGEKIIGVEDKADSRSFYKKYFPQALDLPAIGSAKSINVEEIAKLNPDVVFIPYQQESVVPQFEALGIPVIVVQGESYDELMAMFSLLGQVLNVSSKADQLIKYYEDKIAMIGSLPALDVVPTVYVSRSSEFLETATPLMYQATMVDKAGGKLVSADLTDNYWAKISAEQLQTYNPDIIVISNGSSYTVQDVSGNSQYKGITAIDKEAVYAFPSEVEAWDMPTPASILGILWLTSIIQPDNYSQEDLQKDVDGYYTTFFVD